MTLKNASMIVAEAREGVIHELLKCRPVTFREIFSALTIDGFLRQYFNSHTFIIVILS